MGGKGGQSNEERQQQGYATGYSSYNPGENPVDRFGTVQSNLNIGAYKGWQAAESDYYRKQEQEAAMMGMFEQMMGGGQDQNAMYAQQMADQEAKYAAKLEEQRIAAGREKVGSLYSNYMNSATQSTDFINSEISKEASNAALLGIDYNITDEQKTERISNHFASVWGEGDQQSLEAGIAEFGAPTGFTGFTVKRGVADVAQGPGTETTKATSKGMRPTVLDEEETPGNVLGA